MWTLTVWLKWNPDTDKTFGEDKTLFLRNKDEEKIKEECVTHLFTNVIAYVTNNTLKLLT